MKIARSAANGALWGMLAWQIYAVVEFAFATLAPQAKYGMSIAGWYWKVSFILLLFYSIVGLISGALFGVLTTRVTGSALDETRGHRIAGMLTLTLAFLANLITTKSGPASLLAAVLLLGILLKSLFSRRGGFESFSNPWIGASFLLLSAWIDNEQLVRRSIGVRMGAIVLFTVLVSAISVLFNRLWHRKPRWGRQAGFALAGIALVCAAGLWMDRQPTFKGGAALPAINGTRKPNVLLVTMDTVRADHLSLYGYERNTTPNLSNFASSATVYTRPVAASNGTLTSHSAIFTGVYVSWNGARSNVGLQAPISKKYPMLAETLSAQGYSTVAFAANSAYLIPYFGFDRGFQTFRTPNALRVLSPEKSYCLRLGVRKVLDHLIDTEDFDLRFFRAEEINRSAFRFLEAAKNEDRPFFLFLNYMDAHGPYIPPAPFNTMFPGHDLAIRGSNDAEAVNGTKQAQARQALEHMLSQYNGGIAYIDSQLGELISKLRELGLYDNTFIVITADHGEGFGEHDFWGHGSTVYESVTYVPLIFKFPGAKEGKRIDTPAGQIDIVPTILDTAMVSPPAFLQGRSLRPSAEDRDRVLFSEAFPSPPTVREGRRDYLERAVHAGAFKYIASTRGDRALYDLSDDPGEMHDLCAASPERCAAMQHQLEAFASSAPSQTVPKTTLDPRGLEHLKSLGYLGR